MHAQRPKQPPASPGDRPRAFSSLPQPHTSRSAAGRGPAAAHDGPELVALLEHKLNEFKSGVVLDLPWCTLQAGQQLSAYLAHTHLAACLQKTSCWDDCCRMSRLVCHTQRTCMPGKGQSRTMVHPQDTAGQLQ